jgi:chromosome segregation ATPase
MSEIEGEELKYAKEELQRKRTILRTASRKYDDLLQASPPEPAEVLKAKVGVAEAKVGVAEAKVGVAEAKVGVAEAKLQVTEAKEEFPEKKAEVAELKRELAKAGQELAKAGQELAKAEWELAKTKTEDKEDMEIKKRAYEQTLQGQLWLSFSSLSVCVPYVAQPK